MLFSKMNGIGNDYIFFISDLCNKQEFEYLKRNIERLTIRLSNRYFGIGGDGVVLVEDSKVADAKMHIFNADGSEGKMCGNALRCIGKILSDKRNGTWKSFQVETASGVRQIEIINNEGAFAQVKTKMGKPIFIGQESKVEFYNVGNTHGVFYVDRLDDSAIDCARVVSQKYNVNAEAVCINDGNVSMRVWELGSNETMACGTGATCVAYSLFKSGKFQDSIIINLKGGTLTAFNEIDGVSIIGDAALNYIGEVDLRNYG